MIIECLPKCIDFQLCTTKTFPYTSKTTINFWTHQEDLCVWLCDTNQEPLHPMRWRHTSFTGCLVFKISDYFLINNSKIIVTITFGVKMVRLRSWRRVGAPKQRACAKCLLHRAPGPQCYTKLVVNPLSSITAGELQALQTSRPKPRCTGKDNSNRMKMLCISSQIKESGHQCRFSTSKLAADAKACLAMRLTVRVLCNDV